MNLFGAVGVTQALLPALRRAGGRVVNVSSIGGRITAPSIGVYQASKYALEAFSDALRMETRRQGVTVVIVEPGSIRTEITAKAKREGDARDRRPAAGPGGGLRADGPRAGREHRRPRIDKHAIAPERAAAGDPPRRARPGGRGRGTWSGPTPASWPALKWLLPDRWFDAVILRAMGEHRLVGPNPPRPA